MIDERPQPFVGCVSEHAERGVPGITQSARDRDDPGQDAVEAEVRSHRDHRIEQQLQARLLVEALCMRAWTSPRVLMPPKCRSSSDCDSRVCFTAKMAACVLLEKPSLASIEDT